jgi:hypothetical protein
MAETAVFRLIPPENRIRVHKENKWSFNFPLAIRPRLTDHVWTIAELLTYASDRPRLVFGAGI